MGVFRFLSLLFVWLDWWCARLIVCLIDLLFDWMFVCVFWLFVVLFACLIVCLCVALIGPFLDPSSIPSSALHWSLNRPFISPRPTFIDPSSTLHQPKTTPRPPQDHPKTKTRPPIEKVSIFHHNDDLAMTLAMGTFTENPCARMTILWNKRRTNVDFSSKCWFGVDVGDVGASKRILVREWEFHVKF